MSQKSDYIGSNGKWSGFGSWKESIFVKDQPTNHNKRRRASPIKPCPGAKGTPSVIECPAGFAGSIGKVKKIRADGELGLFVRSLVGAGPGGCEEGLIRFTGWETMERESDSFCESGD
jgi:hypothetical protein